jgi:hypothetical protein
MSDYYTILVMTWLTLRHRQKTCICIGALGIEALAKTYVTIQVYTLNLFWLGHSYQQIYRRITLTCASRCCW